MDILKYKILSKGCNYLFNSDKNNYCPIKNNYCPIRWAKLM